MPIKDIIYRTTKIGGFEVVILEELLILKQGAEHERKNSVKGQKDIVDIMTLLCFANINFEKYKELILKYKLHSFGHRLKEIISTFNDLKYIGFNVKEYSKIKKELLEKLAIT